MRNRGAWAQGLSGLVAVAAAWASGCGPAPDVEDASDVDEQPAPVAATTIVEEQPTVVVVQCPPGSVCTSPVPAPAAVIVNPAPALVLPPAAPRHVHPLVQAEVTDKYPKFRKCYEKGLRRNPWLGGRVFVRMKVDGDGEVDDAFDYGSNLPDRDVVECVVDVFGDLDFGDSVGREVYHSLDFSPTAIRG